MNIRKLILPGVVAIAGFGGVAGGSLILSLDAHAATATTATAAIPAATITTAASPTGTFKSKEDSTHEAGESAAREAQEDAGQMPTVQ